METALIILCICNVVALAIVALRLISLFPTGQRTESAAPPSFTSSSSAYEAPYPTAPMSDDELREARRKFENEVAAFQEIMNYNADVAYGTVYREE